MLISYSGLGPNLATLLPILADRKVPAVLVGTPRAERQRLAAYPRPVASVHRFCKKLGLEGFKDLKVELIRQATEAGNRRDVDINFPFDATSTPAQVMERMEGLYQTTLAETQELLDPAQLDHAAKLIMRAGTVDIYTGSHNLYPAGMFRDRLLSAGKSATCHDSVEAQVRTALASGPDHVAIIISYSGLAPNLKEILPILSSRHVPVIVIGTPYCARIHPGFAAYLTVSDHESMTHRITQFASHIAVQYVLDSLFGCMLALDWERGSDFLSRSLPHTSLPALQPPRLSPAEYAGIMMNRMR